MKNGRNSRNNFDFLLFGRKYCNSGRVKIEQWLSSADSQQKFIFYSELGASLFVFTCNNEIRKEKGRKSGLPDN